MAAKITKAITTKWPDMANDSIYFCNHFLIQHSNSEFTLTFGHVTPPAILGPVTDEALKDMKDLPVKVITRLGMTPERILQLIQILKKNMDTYMKETSDPDKFSGFGGGEMPGGGYPQ